MRNVYSHYKYRLSDKSTPLIILWYIGNTYNLRPMKIGQRIKATRELRGLSQGELARRVGVSQPAASEWESCRSEPTVENLRALAVELDLWFEWLVTGRGARDYDPSQPQPPEYRSAPPLPADERDLQAAYRKLSPARRAALLDFLKHWG